ncbi:hypothetical protein Leryth_008439, partial [Lithospermum erythrorhizon]
DKKKHHSKKIDVLKEEIANLKLKQLRLLGKDLCSVDLKEVLQLEQQLNQALLTIKNKKEQILKSELERAKMEVEELQLKITPTGHAQPWHVNYHPNLANRVTMGGNGSADTICNDGATIEYSDTDLHL